MQRHRQPFAGDGVDVAGGVADQRDVAAADPADLLQQRPGTAVARGGRRAGEPRLQGREARQHAIEAGPALARPLPLVIPVTPIVPVTPIAPLTSIAAITPVIPVIVPQHRHADFLGADRRHVGFAARTPVDLHHVAPRPAGEMAPHSKATAARRRPRQAGPLPHPRMQAIGADHPAGGGHLEAGSVGVGAARQRQPCGSRPRARRRCQALRRDSPAQLDP